MRTIIIAMMIASLCFSSVVFAGHYSLNTAPTASVSPEEPPPPPDDDTE
ncbi:hypothetical protein GF413_03290 [Candidatus Micrarchaeota archaeon]|nr:hypothetical protein [Candidatus Micrarchaeota archaeon]